MPDQFHDLPDQPNLKLTPQRQARLIELIKQAMPLKYCAAAAGISYMSLNRWVARGLDSEEEPYHSFAIGVLQAQGEAVEEMHKLAMGGGKGSAAALFFLERLKRDDYGPVQKIDHTMLTKDAGDGSDPVDTQRQVAAWRAAVLASDLPPGIVGVVDPSPSAGQPAASAPSPADAPVSDGGSTGAN